MCVCVCVCVCDLQVPILCVCVRARARVRACVRACAFARALPSGAQNRSHVKTQTFQKDCTLPCLDLQNKSNKPNDIFFIFFNASEF